MDFNFDPMMAPMVLGPEFQTLDYDAIEANEAYINRPRSHKVADLAEKAFASAPYMGFYIHPQAVLIAQFII